jgi:hypothetical protein
MNRSHREIQKGEPPPLVFKIPDHWEAGKPSKLNLDDCPQQLIPWWNSCTWYHAGSYEHHCVMDDQIRQLLGFEPQFTFEQKRLRIWMAKVPDQNIVIWMRG